MDLLLDGREVDDSDERREAKNGYR